MSDAARADKVGKVLGGRYRLIAPIGVGASGEVYLADDTELRRQVAVKVLHRALAEDEIFLERFRAEAQMAASLNHPNIVAVHDWGEDDVPFIVTEYLSGGSLRAMLDKRGTLTPSQALLIGLEASRGLEYAHKRGVVQRDIKPANILFDADGHVRIADFGIAKALAEASATEPGGQMLGTVRYASPEQALGRRAEAPSDVYSLGLVLFEAIVGELPFDADTPIGTLMARVDTEIELDPALGALRGPIGRACRAGAEHRPDAGELHVALMAAAEKLPRPEPLPLVGAISFDPLSDNGRDHTLISEGGTSGAGAPERRTSGGGKSGRGTSEGAASGGVAGRHGRGDARARSGAADPDAAGRRSRRGADPAGEQDRPTRRWPLALVAVLVIAGAGVATWLAIKGPSTDSDLVPEAAGLTPEEFGLEVGDFWILEEALGRLDGSTPGTILRTEPPAGTDLDEGELLTYVLSQGNEMKMVPDGLVGLPLADAEGFLAGAGLVKGEITERNDETAVAGVVIEVLETRPELPGGSPVDLVLSAGPRKRVVPDSMIGTTFEEAQSQLAVESLVAERAEAFDNAVPSGIVIGVTPAAGTEVDRDSVVQLTVSKGPEPVVIPNVVGNDVPTAAATLRGAGLCIRDTVGPPDTSVIATDPPAGQTVRVGDCVRIITSEFG